MANTDKPAIMVIHQEGMTSALAPQASSPRSLFVVLKPLHPGGGGQDEGALLANKNATPLGTPAVGFQRLSSISLSAMAGTNSSNQLWNLPAEITCKGVTVTLDNNNMWNEFYRCQTEMILTKQGRRMFPCCRFRISGLEPFQSYTLVMDMHPVDNHRYKWSDRRWETNGKGDPHIARSFVHPESPATGLDWMQNPVSFYKLKLTNNPLDQENHIVINSMHRYLPRLHIIPADKTTDTGIQLDGPDIITFSFPQTEFFAVTAYQNLCITQLKIDYNPFAKGFRDDANNSRSSKPKNGLPTETVESEVKPSRETTTLNNLKTLFAKRNAAEKAFKVQPLPVPGEDLKDEDLKAVDLPTTTELKGASKKRPLAEGLSELIKGAHVKVKRMSLEKVHDDSVQQKTTASLSGVEKRDCAAECGERTNLPIATADEVFEDKKELKNDRGIADEKTADETEKQMNVNTVSNLKVMDLATIKSTTELSCSKSSDIQMNSSRKDSDAPINDKVDTALSETTTKTDCKETLQTSGKPLDGEGEVKKKRAEPVPLPLLALFLQQLKSKTRPMRPKSKCETSTSTSETEKACKTTSNAEITSPSTESLNPMLTKQTNIQPAASLTSETSSSSILTCPVANTTVSQCSSLLPTTSFSTSLTTSPTLPDTPTSLRPASSLVVTDPEQDQDKCPDSDLEHKDGLTQSSDSNNVTAPTLPNTSDTVLDCEQEDTPVISSSFSDNILLKSTFSSSTSDTNAVFSDAPCALSPPCSPPEIIPASVFESLKNGVVYSNVSTSESSADHNLDFCTIPLAEFVPEAHQSPLSDDDVDLVFSPSSPAFSIPSPAPSSPDPFPPGLFSDRPIPPRKSLDPFPPCLNIPRPAVDMINAVVTRFSVAKPIIIGDSLIESRSVSPELMSPTPVPKPCVSKESKKPVQKKKSKVKHKKGGKLKRSDDADVTEGPIPVPMQPSLEDVEGQLFVSFMSKKALEIHLGDEAKEDTAQKTENVDVNEMSATHQSIEERIDALEKILLCDLKMMKHRQVIHPVLQAVGLKLNLLDLSLAIDLQYLGVLPIPPPVILPKESSESLASSQVPFVSRTGKTTDFTKIKGWKEKFSTPSSSTLPGGTTSETGQKNLSAFCSDMLDEYLESEGKLIDERAASFTQAVVPPVAYELPTKSTSYVRTLDSVLKKQTSPSTATTLNPFVPSRISTVTSKSKELGKLGENTPKHSFRSGAAKAASSKEGPSFSKRFTKHGTSPDTSPLFSVSPSKKSKITKIKPRKGSKTSQASVRPEGEGALNSLSLAGEAQDSTSGSPGSVAGGRLSKTVAKLLDVEDGAVWEGKRRTYITEERAAIALSSLVTAEGKVKVSTSTVIKRRAPPCLNAFCRLGCVCASLAQERRQHHCGKPQCMLGCNCLRRKVVLLRKPFKSENANEGAISQNQSDEKESEMIKKKKKKKAYIMSGPEEAPEPATRVKSLWDDEKNHPDPECLFIPTPARLHFPPVLSPELQQDLDKFLCSPPRKVKLEGELSTIRENRKHLLTCARVRPFYRKSLPNADQQSAKTSDPHPVPEDTVEEMEEGELRPPALFGPSKRLEIVSQCKWSSEGSRNDVLRVVCEHMAQDRLKRPFWVGKYQILPLSTTVQETDEGSTVTYKICISQPNCVKNTQNENEKIKQLEEQLIKTIGKSEVKGLPLLSHVTPAGLLKAEKKPPGASGQITVNGKPYPQAKLELGQMGALHPANRLAAYITGRVCVANQNASKAVTPATILTTSPTSPTTTITTTTTTTSAVATTSSVTSTPSSVISIKPIVTKTSGGTVFTQVVINHVNTKQQKLPSTSVQQRLSTVKNIIKPSSPVTGVTVSSNMPPNESVSFQAPAASALTDGAVPEKKTVVITAGGSSTVTPGGGVRLMQPVTSGQSSAPGQKMVFQMLKTANGSTLYRNPNGQLIQLVPLNQFRALHPNVMLSKQTTIVRLPSSTASKPQNSSTSTVTTSTPLPATSSTLLLKAQNPTPVHNPTTVSMTKTISTSEAEKAVAALTGANSSQSSTVSIVPGMIGNPGTGFIKIVPQTPINEPKIPRITVTSLAPSTQCISNVDPKNGGFFLITPQTSLTTKNQENEMKMEMKTDSNVHITPSPAEGSKQNDQPSSSSQKPAAENVVLEDHCYTFEAKKTSILSHKPGNVPKESTNSAGASSPSTIPEDVLDFAPIEEDDEFDAVLECETVAKSNAELNLEDSDSELTEDSDMYDDSNNTSDQENLYIDTDSDEGEKQKRKRKSVASYMQSLDKKEDDELVDIETYEENSESNDQRAVKEKLRRKQKVEQEMERRSYIRERFYKLQMTLNHVDGKSSRMSVLKQAREEIHTLSKEAEELIKLKKKLKKNWTYYLEMASRLSGKSKESISQKLSEIIAKQKALESQEKAKSTTQAVPKPTLTDEQKRLGFKDKVNDTFPRHVQLSPSSRPVDLSISRQKRLGSQDIGNLEAKQKVSEAQEEESISTASQSATPLNINTTSQNAARERMRPNILSRKSPSLPVSPAKKQVFGPQVIPMMPCNQIITISNPLQPIGITSLGERQSTTPGVAAVSISVPAISHPIRVENPVSVLQPHVLGLANSPVKINSPGKTINLPKISSVVSLVSQTPSLLQKTDIPLVKTHAACNPMCVEAHENSSSAVEEQDLDKQLVEDSTKQSEQGTKVSVADATVKQKEERKDGANSETEVENLMSLLDELEFLNQQLNSETSQLQREDSCDMKTSNVPTDVLIEKEAGVDRDDERSLSPLFLRLDEDLMSSTPSKDELDDIPPKVDDLVKVIFGSDSPPNSSESEATAGVNDDSSHGPACRVKSDAPSLPPLLQMKAGGGTTTDISKDQAGVSWRPMPKLAPLGLKTQESGQNKTVSSHVTKPGSQPPSLRSAHM